MALLSAMFLAAMWGAVARAQVTDTQLEITEFEMKPMPRITSPHSYPPDAGGRQPRRGPLLEVLRPRSRDRERRARRAGPTTPAPVRTSSRRRPPHGVNSACTVVKIRGVRLRSPSGQRHRGSPTAVSVPPSGDLRPREVQARRSRAQPPTIDDTFAPGPARSDRRGHAPCGCNEQQFKSQAGGVQARAAAGLPRQPDRARGLPHVHVHRLVVLGPDDPGAFGHARR